MKQNNKKKFIPISNSESMQLINGANTESKKAYKRKRK